MFGLWFSIAGLIFGTLCSLKAKEKNKAQEDWFTLGFIFSFLALGVLHFLPSVGGEPKKEGFKLENREEDISLFVIE